MIETAEYLDGIGFLKDGIEIAFYSSITKRLEIPHTAVQAYKDEFECYGCTDIPIGDMQFIMEEINKFILKESIKNG